MKKYLLSFTLLTQLFTFCSTETSPLTIVQSALHVFALSQWDTMKEYKYWSIAGATYGTLGLVGELLAEAFSFEPKRPRSYYDDHPYRTAAKESLKTILRLSQPLLIAWAFSKLGYCTHLLLKTRIKIYTV